MAFTPPAVDEIDESQPKFTPPAPDAFDPLQNVKLSDYEKYRIAIGQGATPENYSELGLPPSQNPDYDIVREAGPVPGVSGALKFVSDKVIEPIAAQIFTGLKQSTAGDQPVRDDQKGTGAAAYNLKPVEPGKPMLSLPRLTQEEMDSATTGEQVAAGIGEGLAGTIEGFTTPGNVLTLPFAEAKPVQAYFGAQMAATVPESLKAIGDAKTPQDLARAYTALTANVGMGALLAHSAFNEGGPHASENTQAAPVHGDVRSQPIDVEAQVSPAESGGGIQPKPAQKAQVPLSDEHAKMLAEHMTEEGHAFAKLPEGRVMLADHDSGQVLVDPEQFGKWVDNDLQGLTPEEKAEAVKSAFDHENIHLKTDPDDAEPFWESMSPFEQFVLKRQYLKGQDESKFSPAQLGFEAIRNRVERAMNMTRSDFVGMALHERWTAQALDHLAHIVGKIRSLRDSELSEHQKSILDKVRDNIEAAQNAVKAGVGAGVANQPFMLRQDEEPGGEVPPFLKKGPGETTVSEFMNLSDEDAQKFFDGNIKRGNPIQNDAVLAGMKMGVDKIPELTKMRDQMHELGMKKLEKAFGPGGDGKAPAELGKVIWLNGVLEGAARKGPNYESVTTRLREQNGPAMLRREEEERSMREAFNKGAWPKDLPSQGKALAPSFNEYKRQVLEEKRMANDAARKDGGPIPYPEAEGPAMLRKVDWKNLESVKEYAEKLGPGMVVIKHPGRDNYNITHASRTDLYDPSWVVHQTGGEKSFPAMLRKKGKAGEQEEMFGPITQKGVPGGEDVQPTTAREAGALPKQYGDYQTSPGKIDFEQLNKKSKTKGELPFRFITPSEAKNPTALGEVLVSNARLEGSDLPVSSSRRLTALFDNQTGEVHLVSTYKGDGKIRMVDPERAGKDRPNRPVDDMLERYTPIYSMLLQEPVQNFHEAFPNLEEFQNKLGTPAAELQRMYGTGTEGIPKTSMAEEQSVGPRYPREREPNLPRPTTDELQSFHDFFGDTIPSDRTMFEKRLLQSSGKANRRMISGLEKLMDIEKANHRGISDRQALDMVLDRLYENITSSDTRSDFVQRTMAQRRLTSAEADAKIKLYLARLERQRQSTTRELTAPEFPGPRKPATGTGVEPPPPAQPVPPAMLSPEERAALESEVEKEHNVLTPERSAELMKSIAESPVQKERYRLAGEQSIQDFEEMPKAEDDEAEPSQSEIFPQREMMSEKHEDELQHEEGEDFVTKAARENKGRTKGESGMRQALEKAESTKRQEQLDLGKRADEPKRDYEFEQHRLSREIRELRQKLSTAVDSEKPGIREQIMQRVVEYENKYGELPWGEGPAMLRKVEETAEKVKDYLARTGANVKSAGDLSDQLYRLKTSEKADYDLALPVIKSALKIIPEADRPTLLKYADEMQVLKKSDIKLTDAQETMYQTFLKPLLDDNQKMYRSLMRAGIPVGESTYLGRMVQDTHSLYNRLWKGTKQRITEGSLLGQGASFFKRRVFKALESPDGERRLIALVGDGKNTRVIGYEKGKAELLGKMPPESLEPQPLSPQQIRTQRIVEARRLQELDKLDKEEQALLKEKDRLSKDPKADPAVMKELDARLASINGDYAEVGEKYPSPVFDVPRMWKDKNGKKWKFTDATISEIEQNTNTRYYQEPMSGVITQNLKLKQIYRANQFLEDLKNSEDFKRISRSVNERNVPEDWRTVDLPQFRGLRIEPRTADVLDLFSQESRGPSLPMKYVTKLTNFLRNTLFVWNPFVHEPNLLTHWFTARGSEWVKPPGYDRMVKSGVAALHDVMTRSRFRDQALRAGAPLLRGMGDINQQVMKLIRKELDPDPSLATKLARGLGYINPLRMIRAFGDSLTWGTNEVLTLQLIRETMERTGLPLEEAVSEVGKHMPNYRIPPRVLNSRLISHVMRNPLTTLWGHYHYGALRSYGEMGKEIFSPKSTIGQRMEGLGRVATIGFLMAAAYPAIDELVNKVLKTKGLKMRRAGSATFPQGVLDVARGKKTPEALVQSVLTPSPVTQSGFELAFNRNLRSGLPVYERRLGTDTLKDLGSFAANKVSPIEEAGRVFGGKKSGTEFGLGLAGITRTRADSAMSRFGRMADNWMRTNTSEDIREQYKRRTQDVFQESDYQLLRSAIIREDDRAAQLAVNKLLKTRKPEEVNRRIKQWQDSPFTGTRKTDRALMEEMTPKDWDLWYQAAQERLDIADGMRNALVDALVKPQ